MRDLKDQVLQVLGEPGLPAEDLRRRLLAVLQEPAHAPKMSYEEFLEWADEDTHAEWVRGEVVMTSPASYQHARLCSFLVGLLGFFVESRGLGIVLTAPFQVKLPDSGREPGVLFLSSEHMDRLKNTYIDGPADLVIEIMSPESAARDRGEKYYEYEAARIPEYWLIDPVRERAEFYRLDPGRQYQPVLPDAEGIYRSEALPGFWLPVAWLWGSPALPQALRRLGLL